MLATYWAFLSASWVPGHDGTGGEDDQEGGHGQGDGGGDGGGGGEGGGRGGEGAAEPP